METKLKGFLGAALAFCGFISAANAADMQHNGQHQHHGSSDDARFREITPNAGPRVTNGADVFISADFTYWTARQDGLEYARSGLFDLGQVNANAVTVAKGSTFFPPRKFEPGFKVGLGLNLGHDGWDVFLQYTWFHTNHTNTQNFTDNAVDDLHPLWDMFGEVPELSTVNVASGKWRLRFNNFDLELGRNFYVSQYLAIRPHVGLKGCWYRQNYNVTYDDLDIVFIESLSTLTADIPYVKNRMKQSYWGVGFRGGLNTSWFFDKNWSIFGDLALSSLWGRFDVSRKDAFRTDREDPETEQRYTWTERDFHSMKGVLEAALGLRFDYWFSDDDYHFGLQAAWEEQVWFNHNQFFRDYTNMSPQGDLGFQGLTLKARFDF